MDITDKIDLFLNERTEKFKPGTKFKVVKEFSFKDVASSSGSSKVFQAPMEKGNTLEVVEFRNQKYLLQEYGERYTGNHYVSQKMMDMLVSRGYLAQVK